MHLNGSTDSAMAYMKKLMLWMGCSGALILPVLSHVGLTPLHIEYLLTIALLSLVANILMAVARIPYVNVITLISIYLLAIWFYYGNHLLTSQFLVIGSIIIATVLALLAYYHFDKALTLIGLVAWSQIIVAAIFTPSHVVRLSEKELNRSDHFSVIHILLDEHAGIASLPKRKLRDLDVNAFERDYTERGFRAYTHAYTNSFLTTKSLRRIFNVNTPRKGGHLITNNSDHAYLSKASAFDYIAQKRAIDITQIEHVNFDYALRHNPAVARNLTYNIRTIENNFSTLSFTDRLLYFSARINNWGRKSADSPIAHWLFPIIGLKWIFSPFAVSSLQALKRFKTHLIENGQRGTYYFIHLLLPHHPYVLDKNCTLMPVRQWHDDDKRNRGTTEKKRYALYVNQASCAKRTILELVDALSDHKALHDAVILIHSDHGARLSYVRSDYHQNMRGAFFVVRLPDKTARIIDTPARVSFLYGSLLAHDFMDIKIVDHNAHIDSPYRKNLKAH